MYRMEYIDIDIPHCEDPEASFLEDYMKFYLKFAKRQENQQSIEKCRLVLWDKVFGFETTCYICQNPNIDHHNDTSIPTVKQDGGSLVSSVSLYLLAN